MLPSTTFRHTGSLAGVALRSHGIRPAFLGSANAFSQVVTIRGTPAWSNVQPSALFDFEDTSNVYEHRSTANLLFTLGIFKLCSIGLVTNTMVNHGAQLLDLAQTLGLRVRSL